MTVSIGQVAYMNGQPAAFSDAELVVLWRSVAMHTDAMLKETADALAAMTAERDELSQDKHALKMVVSAAIAACGELTAERDALQSQVERKDDAIVYAVHTILDDFGDEVDTVQP